MTNFIHGYSIAVSHLVKNVPSNSILFSALFPSVHFSLESLLPLTIAIEAPAVCLGRLELGVAAHQETKTLLVMKRQWNIPFPQLDHVIHRLVVQMLIILYYQDILPYKCLLVASSLTNKIKNQVFKEDKVC